MILHRIGEAFNHADAKIGTSNNKNNNYDGTHNYLLNYNQYSPISIHLYMNIFGRVH